MKRLNLLEIICRMKFLFYLYLILLIPNLSNSQETIYLDIDQTIIDKSSFHNKWLNRDNMLSRWDSIGKNKKRYATLRKSMYEIGISDYKIIKEQLLKITSKKIDSHAVILLNFKFKDDLCDKYTDNLWTRGEINKRKHWLKPRLKKFDNENILYFWLFENGIKLKTKSNKKDEFFFLDKNNFFREKIFVSKTLCSSAALITKQGEILVMNGEGSIMDLYNHLINNEVPLFFKN